MTVKKIINAPEDIVHDALRGIEAAHPGLLAVDHDHRYVYRARPKTDRVALVSGGGSGHEPLHAGFVGTGALDAAVAGEIFTSPTPDQIQAATARVDAGHGVLHIVKNYTGDVLNFELAAELAQSEGSRVRAVVIDDDVAVQDSTFTAGRRGVGGTVLVERLAGAAAEEGRDLDSVAELATRVNAHVRSFGIALSSPSTPDSGKHTFELPDDEIEIGIGIHGEPGRRRVPLARARELADLITEPVLADLDVTGAPGIVLLSGLGGTPLLELYVLYAEVAALLDKAGITVARSLVGNYITSLDAAGASLTVLRADDELLRLWDSPVRTAALRWGA